MEINIERVRQPKKLPSDPHLGFGKIFTDHMYTLDYDPKLGWHNSKVEPFNNLQLDPSAAVLHYGQAVFEGMKAFRGVDGIVRIFRPDMNWQRMKRSAERLCMDFISYETFLTALKNLVRTDEKWVPALPGTSLYLRPTLIATEGFLGLRPAETLKFFIIASPVSGYYGEKTEPVKIWVERDYSRAVPGGTGSIKAAGNYAASLTATVAAKKRGYSQVLWLDAIHKKYIEEVGAMNVFFIVGDKVLTPALTDTILPGITRDSIIQLLKASGRIVEERPITLNEILEAHASGTLKEVFGTGTAASVSAVGELGLGDRSLVINNGCTGSVTQELFQALTDIQYARSPDLMNWMVRI